jgi:hypothetical protein
MNVSKTLAAAIAATSIVGAVGLAYAQTTSDTPVVPASPTTTTQEPSTQGQVDGSQGTQSGTAPVQSDTGSTVTPTQTPAATESERASEPMPKADRN